MFYLFNVFSGQTHQNSVDFYVLLKNTFVLPFRQCLYPIFSVGRRFALTYGYESLAFQAIKFL